MQFSRTGGLTVILLATMALSGCGSDDPPAVVKADKLVFKLQVS